jgi:hypothetical protein
VVKKVVLLNELLLIHSIEMIVIVELQSVYKSSERFNNERSIYIDTLSTLSICPNGIILTVGHVGSSKIVGICV